MNVFTECEISRRKLKALNNILSLAWEHNRFYQHKWTRAGMEPCTLESLEELTQYPLTTRHELFTDQEFSPPLGRNLSCAHDELKRFHRSSGTTEAPLLWGDTVFSWEWVLHGSADLWRISGVQSHDKILFASPLNANSGPWIMFEGACRVGCACIFTGDYTANEIASAAHCFRPTVLAGKPGILEQVGNLEPCGSIHRVIITGPAKPEVRSRLEKIYGECFDRYGMTEAGSVAAECSAHPGAMHLLDEAFIAEVIDSRTGMILPDGERGELILTTLGRYARPIVRYKTGDLVTLNHEAECLCGRTGTMIIGAVERLNKK